MPGRQRSLCVVGDWGVSQPSTAAADTWVRVNAPVHPVESNNIISGLVRVVLWISNSDLRHHLTGNLEVWTEVPWILISLQCNMVWCVCVSVLWFDVQVHYNCVGEESLSVLADARRDSSLCCDHSGWEYSHYHSGTRGQRNLLLLSHDTYL